jgi:hypothetical protein
MSTSDTIVVDLLHTPDSDADEEEDDTTQKRQYRWNPSRHISLLRIILLRLPFSAPYKTKGVAWESVAEDYNLAVKQPNAIKGRKANEKFYSLLSIFRKNKAASLRKSGTNEEYTELDQLLEDLDELEHDSRIENEAIKEINQKKVVLLM